MMPQYFHFLWISCLGLLLFVFAEWLYYSKKTDVEITRKIVHIGSGLLALLFPVFMKNQWWVLLLCGLFQLIVVVSMNNGYLKSINAVKRKTYGSIVYPIVVYMVYLAWFYSGSISDQIVQSYAYFYLPILTLALSDPLASLAGKYYPIIKIGNLGKSLGGLLTFWIVTFLLSCFILLYSDKFNMKDITWVAIFIATIATMVELYSRKGLDNLYVPLAVLIGMYVVEYFF